MRVACLGGRRVCARRGTRAGFTLTEVAIVLAVLMPLLLFTLDVLGPMLAFQGGQDTRRRLE